MTHPWFIFVLYASICFGLGTSCLEATIEPDSATHTIIKDTNLFLTCECSDATSTLPTLWYRDGSAISTDLDNVRTVKHDRKLIILSVQPKDSGNYSCSIGNATSKKINLIVIELQTPDVVPNGSHFEGCKGRPLSIGLNLTNFSPSDGLLLLFYDNGSYVSDRMPYVYNYTTTTLIFHSLNVLYSGKWRIHVSNSHGSATADFVLNITDCSDSSRESGAIILKMDLSICLLTLLFCLTMI